MVNSPLEDSLFAELLEPQGLPSSQDRLFTSGEDWWNNACINWSGSEWNLYATGYKEAADLIVARIEERKACQDTLVYPIMFLYRQYLELEIKDTLRMARRLQDVSSEPPMIHNISDLWSQLHKLLIIISPGDSVNELNEISRLIGEFSEVDRQSYAFRYPVNKEGKPSLPGITRINLRNVREVIAKVSVILSGANSQIYEYLQFKFEQERAYRNDY